MGIYDREYYRDERSSFLGTLAREGHVWKTLILINVAAFILQLAFADWGVNGWFTDLFAINTEAILHGQVWRLLTGAFLHSAGWQHIVFNMLIVWWFGSEVEGIYGAREFLAFYVTAAVVASAAFVAGDVLAGKHSTAIGASGAATAVMVLFALHFPNRMILFFGIIPVPALLLVAIYVALDAFGAIGGRPGEHIAFTAHLGGAAFGCLYYKFHWRITNLWPGGWSVSFRRPRPKLRVYSGEAEGEPVPVGPPRTPPDSQLEAELDAVLEKVARHGKSSLTEREQQVLMRASEIYRNRRK